MIGDSPRAIPFGHTTAATNDSSVRSLLSFPAAARVPFPESVALGSAQPRGGDRSRCRRRPATTVDSDRPLDLAPIACRNVVVGLRAVRYGPPGRLHARPA